MAEPFMPAPETSMALPLNLSLQDDRVAVITGAAAGIGRGTAIAFHRAGAHLVLIDVDASGLADTVALMAAAASETTGPAASGARPEISTHVCSVADEQAMLAVAAAMTTRWGRCDVLVNNAGILLRGPFAGLLAAEQWRQTLDVNLSGAFYVTRAFLPLLQAARGCIVNVASIHASVAVANSVAYTASKGGLKQLTQALALELAPMGIRVNAVAPGSIATNMTAQTRANAEAGAKFLDKVPLARHGEVADVVNAIHFLASDLAGYITGAMLPVDGGYLAI
jgi:NAD(P)-dependent dehydrogenase (short-subunit alcohol dehydrogenase family)